MSLTACNDFLDIKPYGKTIPKTHEEFKALIDNVLDQMDKGSIGGEQLLGNYSSVTTFEECTDNLETNLTTYPGGNYLSHYIGDVLNSKQSVYRTLYELIRTANIAIEGYDSEGERKDSDLIGTCYAIRGVAYYQLLRQFAAPAMTEDATLGVPLMTEFNLEAKPDRSSYNETVFQAESDMKKALSYHIEDKMYRFNDYAMKACLARLYHWTGQWQQAYDYAMEVVEEYPLLDSLNYRKMQETQYGLQGNRIVMGNLLSGGGSGASSVMETIKNNRPISKRFLDLFPEGKRDVRYAIAVGNRRRSLKLPFAGIRSAEMYLIAMEAKAQMGQATENPDMTKEAMQMLQNLRRLRCPTKPVLTLQPIPDTELIREDATGKPLTTLMYNILKERRKEMYMENGDRFFELKRNGRPEFWVANKGMKYWTRKYMYTFPLPVQDFYVQPSLKQNPGYEEVE